MKPMLYSDLFSTGNDIRFYPCMSFIKSLKTYCVIKQTH